MAKECKINNNSFNSFIQKNTTCVRVELGTTSGGGVPSFPQGHLFGLEGKTYYL